MRSKALLLMGYLFVARLKCAGLMTTCFTEMRWHPNLLLQESSCMGERCCWLEMSRIQMLVEYLRYFGSVQLTLPLVTYKLTNSIKLKQKREEEKRRKRGEKSKKKS
ncbi:hypothetical protein LOAG_09849 [Loa loa]|uniref:Secreted protein n=1 Tax=Loa loa TaxID=7209 RepID=A0A1S0TR78_LOALO|nr:hypothetical protein LOAG_09849 [Loa loa]EFO18645.1 hypothetical protein LOAG_09849 [Loa loa]